MAWFTKASEAPLRVPTEALWNVCKKCGAYTPKSDYVNNLKVCPACGAHGRLSARERIELLADKDSFKEIAAEVIANDPLTFSDASGDYASKVKVTREKTKIGESIVVGTAKLDKIPVVLGAMDFSFMGGSLGSGTGERILQAAERIEAPLVTLRLLAPAYRENIILLADAILWQGQWMLCVYAGDCGIDYEAPLLDEGFETLELLSGDAEDILTDKKEAPALRQAVQTLVDKLGGAAMLNQPAQLLQKRWAKDYKTALHFFTGICAAAAMENDQDCAAALQQQYETLRYFRQGGAWELLRLDALAEQFHLALTEIGDDSHPFGDPVLPANRRSAARMQALAPFFDTLPQLKTLLLKPQENDPS